MRKITFGLSLSILFIFLGVLPCEGHSGKARWHAIVDTDGAADDLRALCMLLANHEVEVLGIVSSSGALSTERCAENVVGLLSQFYNQGIPVGVGRDVLADAPGWRSMSERVVWSDTKGEPMSELPEASELLLELFTEEDEAVTYIALGALTNVYDLMQKRPEAAERIERIIWYNDGENGANYMADTQAADYVLRSGVPVQMVGYGNCAAIPVSAIYIDSVGTINSPYALKIGETHHSLPLSELVDKSHLKYWDDLVVAYLFRPELFEQVNSELTGSMYQPQGCAQLDVEPVLIQVLRGKVDAESRVFYGFPTDAALYAVDVQPFIDSTLLRYGMSEWRAGVLANELHGHLGIYAIIGVKMGIRAREYFNIGVDDVVITTFAGSTPPISCMNDGLQVSTGGTLGHGLITVSKQGPARPQASFTFKNKEILLTLKPEYSARIAADVKRGVELYGSSPEYWQYIRALALQYWRDFDRHEIFEIAAL